MPTTLSLLLVASSALLACSGSDTDTDTDTTDTDTDTDTTDTDPPATTGETGETATVPDTYAPTWTGVQELFAEHCDVCHPAEQGFDLHIHLETPLQPYYSYVIPGDPENSFLWGVLTYEYLEPRMPPTGRLPDETIQCVHDWILAGAVFE
jgi:hypothetical protein